MDIVDFSGLWRSSSQAAPTPPAPNYPRAQGSSAVSHYLMMARKKNKNLIWKKITPNPLDSSTTTKSPLEDTELEARMDKCKECDAMGKVNAAGLCKDCAMGEVEKDFGLQVTYKHPGHSNQSVHGGAMARLGGSLKDAVSGTARNVGTVLSIPKVVLGHAGRGASRIAGAVQSGRTKLLKLQGLDAYGNKLKKARKESEAEVTYKHPGHPDQTVHSASGRARAAGSAVMGAAKKYVGASQSVGRAMQGGVKKYVGASMKVGRGMQKIAGKVGDLSPTKKLGQAYGRSIKTNFQTNVGLGKRALGAVRSAFGKEAPELTVFKDAQNEYRWVVTASNAFIDKDRQIISRAALQADVERTDQFATKDYGPLRWWHVGVPDGPGLDIGTCDFRMLHGKMLIESGTFKTPALAEAVKQVADQLEVSIGFKHAASEPDTSGIFHSIKTFERSLLPSGKASNLLTTGITVA